jgi:hypothetical protein
MDSGRLVCWPFSGFRREVELPLILERASSTYLGLDIPVIRHDLWI